MMRGSLWSSWRYTMVARRRGLGPQSPVALSAEQLEAQTSGSSSPWASRSLCFKSCCAWVEKRDLVVVGVGLVAFAGSSITNVWKMV